MKRKTNHGLDASNGLDASFIMPPGLRERIRESGKTDTLVSEQVHLLYSNLPASIISSVLLAIILVYIQSAVISSGLLAGWSIVLCAVLLSRAGLFYAWKRSVGKTSVIDTSRWLEWFRISVIITGLVWGGGGVLLAPSGDIGHKVYVTFVLAGLCAGASATLAIDRVSIYGFLFTILTPQILFLFNEGDIVSFGMGSMCVLFLLFLLVSASQLRLRLEENFHLRHNAIESESRFRYMLESSPIAARIVDAVTNRVIFANKSYISLIGSTREQVIGIDPSTYYADAEDYDESMEQLRNGRHVVNKLIKLQYADASAWTKWVLASYFAVDYQNKPAILGWFYDITDRKVMQDRVEHMAYHDALTGLPNRTLFDDRIQQSIANAEREQSVLALLFLDLDNFKPVNDQHGHGIGDLLLMAVAKRIITQLRKTDSAARVGGDEFVILLPLVKTQENALIISENIRQELEQPFAVEELSLHVSSSIGVAIYPDHASDEKKLLKLADIAMYYAKQEGGNCVRVYHPGMDVDSECFVNTVSESSCS